MNSHKPPDEGKGVGSGCPVARCGAAPASDACKVESESGRASSPACVVSGGGCGATLPLLDSTHAFQSVELSRSQVVCLLSHMMMGCPPTLAESHPGEGHGEEAPESSFRDFLVWFGRGNGSVYSLNPSAVHAYLATMLCFFSTWVLECGHARVRPGDLCDASPLIVCKHVLRSMEGLASTTSTATATTTKKPAIKPATASATVAATATATATADMGQQAWRTCDVKLRGFKAGGLVRPVHPPQRAVVVFANAAIGFGPCGTQEELLFGMRPEACVATLFMPRLQAREACYITGARTVGSYTGFRATTRWAGALHSTTATTPKPCSCVGRRGSHALLVMDAVEFPASEDAPCDADSGAGGDGVGACPALLDVQPQYLFRELSKALCGFAAARSCRSTPTHSLAASWTLSRDRLGWTCRPSAAPGLSGDVVEVASGHWGCGAFGGNREVKALIQACAASCAGVTVVFFVTEREWSADAQAFTAGSSAEAICRTVMSLQETGAAVRDVVAALLDLPRQWRGAGASASPVLDFVLQHVGAAK